MAKGARKKGSILSTAGSLGRSLSVEVSSNGVRADTRNWTVERRASGDGPASLLKLEWPQPVNGIVVWEWLMDSARSDSKYRHFKAYPTPGKSPSTKGAARA